MDLKFVILDERDVWYQPAIATAWRRGYQARRIKRGSELTDADVGGVGFIRPHAEPAVLRRNQLDYDAMRGKLCMIQDEAQVRVYERKSLQAQLWHQWMPATALFGSRDAALGWAYRLGTEDVVVSKANEGASSVNVRILTGREAVEKHIHEIFDVGIPVNPCASNKTRLVQKDYALFQEFIPHTVTWRVNAIGNGRAIFKRFCYPDRPVAQTGNVEPVMEITPEIESLLDFANLFLAQAKTKWVALDILKAPAGWRLLETSLAWPWPSPGLCNEAPIFFTKHKWIGMWDAMFDEYEGGAWAS